MKSIDTINVGETYNFRVDGLRNKDKVHKVKIKRIIPEPLLFDPEIYAEWTFNVNKKPHIYHKYTDFFIIGEIIFEHTDDTSDVIFVRSKTGNGWHGFGDYSGTIDVVQK